MCRKRFIHPVSPFHHPPPGFETGIYLGGLGIFTPAPEMGCETKLVQGGGASQQNRSHCPGTRPGDAPGWASGT